MDVKVDLNNDDLYFELFFRGNKTKLGEILILLFKDFTENYEEWQQEEKWEEFNKIIDQISTDLSESEYAPLYNKFVSELFTKALDKTLKSFSTSSFINEPNISIQNFNEFVGFYDFIIKNILKINSNYEKTEEQIQENVSNIVDDIKGDRDRTYTQGFTKCEQCEHYVDYEGDDEKYIGTKRCDHPKLNYSGFCYDFWLETNPIDSCSYWEKKKQ